MKLKILILFFFFIYVDGILAQEKKNGFSDIRLSYIVSSLSAGENFFINGETLMPYGIGLETTYSFGTKIRTEFGMSFKTTGMLKDDGYIIRESDGYSGPTHREYIRNHFDFPVHLHYMIVSPKSLDITLISGFKPSFIKLKSDNNPDSDGYVGKIQNTWFGISLDLGLEECLKISDKFGVFASQVFGYYFIGDYKELFAIDLNIGLKYNFK